MMFSNLVRAPRCHDGWRLCPCCLVPVEELKRDEVDLVLDKILASAAETGTAEGREAVAGAGASLLASPLSPNSSQPSPFL